jgi:hypothetical protein
MRLFSPTNFGYIAEASISFPNESRKFRLHLNPSRICLAVARVASLKNTIRFVKETP